MQLPLQNFSAQVAQFAGAAQAASAAPLDFSPGEPLRAIGEASASVGLWMQYQLILVLRTTRLATSTGADVDSWLADFGLTRAQAVAATGQAVFARYTATQAALVPVGATAKTADGTQSFTVVADTTNPAWNAALGGYTLAAGAASVSVPVQAVTPGSAGNIQANTLTLLSAAIPFVNTVNNPAAFTNGIDAQSDAAAREAFAGFILSLRAGTPASLVNAANGVQAGLSVEVLENTPANGCMTLIVDDGTGSPPASLLAAVTQAAEAVRAQGTVLSVRGPNLVAVNIALTLTVAPGVNKANLAAPVVNAITAFVDALAVDATLAYSRIPQLAFDVDPGIVNVTGVVLNGGTADLVSSTPGTVFRVQNVTVS